VARLLYGDAASLASSVFLADAPAVEFQITDRLLSLVERLCARRPTAMVIENLQWADPSTLLFLHRLARQVEQSPLLLVLTSRPVPWYRAQEQLMRSLEAKGNVTRLALSALAPGELTALVQALAGGEPGPNLVRQAQAAGGNPLFVHELIAALKQARAIHLREQTAEIGNVELPRSLALTILHRLSFLDPDTLEVLRVASVLGSRFDLDILLRVLDRTAVMLMPALRESIAAGILRQGDADLAFRHELIRESLYLDLPAGLSNALHMEAARAMAAAGESVNRFSEHIMRGARPGDSQALRWLQAAAHEANPQAPRLAAEMLERALQLAGTHSDDRDPLLAELAVSLVWSGRIQDAERICRERLNKVDNASAGTVLYMTLAQSLLSRGLLVEALDVAQAGVDFAPASEVDRSRFLAWTAMCRLSLADVAGANDAVAVATAAANEAEDPLAQCIALSVTAGLRLFDARYPEGLVLVDDAVSRADSSPGRHAHRFPVHFFRARVLAELDRMDDACEAIDAGRRVAEELGARSSLAGYAWVSALVCFQAGKWDDAHIECDTCFDLAADTGLRVGILSAHAVRGLLAIHRNDLLAAETVIEAVEQELASNGSMVGLHWTMWTRALLLEATGEPGEAKDLLATVWNLCAASGLHSELPALGPDLTRLALAVGDDTIAYEVVERLEAISAANPQLAGLRGCSMRCRGLLERSPDILARAADTYRPTPRLLERAGASEDAADALARSGNTTESRTRFAEALAIYEQIGAARDLARTEARMRAHGLRRGRRGPRLRPTTGWASLTTTELKIVDLVAQGLSNPEIAERLFLSRLTVRTHVSSLLRKLTLTSRVELATEVVRRSKS
jgi:DNA-binding CsgD family transcriptional regulator/tetratricopeptide (TPR) repeat protein